MKKFFFIAATLLALVAATNPMWEVRRVALDVIRVTSFVDVSSPAGSRDAGDACSGRAAWPAGLGGLTTTINTSCVTAGDDVIISVRSADLTARLSGTTVLNGGFTSNLVVSATSPTVFYWVVHKH